MESVVVNGALYVRNGEIRRWCSGIYRRKQVQAVAHRINKEIHVRQFNGR